MNDKKRTTISKKYISEMNIIKLRTNLVLHSNIKYLQPKVEFEALQLRKIIEQIILASLVANSDKYKEMYGRLEKDWHARLISKDLERINPDFYPNAVINQYDNKQLINKTDAIGISEMIDIYEKLGKMMHSENPFASPIDYKSMETFIHESMKKIIYLLSTHIIKPYGEDSFMFVVMNDLRHNSQVGINWFSPLEKTK